MYITGIGRTKFGLLQESLGEMAYCSISLALEDAQMQLEDVEAVYVANFVGGPLERQLHMNALVADLLPDLEVPIVRVEAACASGGAALYQALMALQRFETVLVVGAEKLSTASGDATAAIAMAGDRFLDQREGLTFSAAYALIAQQHMMTHGTTSEDLAHVALKNHENANLNSYAHFYGSRFELGMIMDSPVVCSPLRLLDSSPLSDGGCALIVSRKSRGDRCVEVAASALVAGNLAFANTANVLSFRAAQAAARQAYAQAGVGPTGVDIFMVHDCFTIAELVAMEDLGLCRPGESARLVREGRTRIDGAIPVNPDGGLKADGHPIGASGLAQVYEIVTQLRGEACDRQVRNARVGLAHNVGGVGGTAAVHIFRKE